MSMSYKLSKSKRIQAIIALAIAALLVMTGTFAWYSFNQQRINTFNLTSAPNVNLHDDFAGGPEKDVYVENSGQQPVLVRVHLTELLIQNGTLLPDGADDDEIGTNWHVHTPLEGVCEVCEFKAHEYFKWTMNGQKFYMPAPESAHGDDDTEPLAVGDLDAIIDYAGLLRNAFTENTTVLGYIEEYLSGDATHAAELQEAIKNMDPDVEVPNVRQYDGQPDTELVRKLSEVRLTLIPEQIITMQDWLDGTTYDDPCKTGDFWVVDSDGWCYWANALQAGEATGQLLSSVDNIQQSSGELIYRINVVLNATTFADDELDDFFMTDKVNGDITEQGKKLMLIASGTYVLGADGELYINDGGGLYGSYKTGGTIFAGADGVPGSGDDLTVGATLTVAGTEYTISGFTMGTNGVVIGVTGADETTAYLTPVNENGELDPQGGQYAFISAGEDGEIGSEDDGVSADPNFAGGFGTAESPLLIATKEQLEYMRGKVNTNASYSDGKHFKQTDDIDLGSVANWTPIGFSTTYLFKGVYDGDGYSVTGLNSSSDTLQFVGLFGCVNGGTVKNLSVTGNVAIEGNRASTFAGGIAGTVQNGGTVSDCVFSGSVSGYEYVGGIVGCASSNGVVRNCAVAYGSVVTGRQRFTGGVVGELKSGAAIESCYSLAKVTGVASFGGITGSNGDAISTYEKCSVTNSAFLKTAALNNTLNAVGIGGGTVTNTDPISDLTVGLLPLLNNGGAAWSQDPGGSWPLPAVIRDRSLGTYLGDPNYVGGKGTEAEPYLIATKAQLEYMRDRVNANTSYAIGKYFKQTADIDLSSVANWVPIGSGPSVVSTEFNGGVYDGNGYTIRGLNIIHTDNSTQGYYVGLFGQVKNGSILNLAVEGSIVNTADVLYSRTGGIAGLIWGSKISGCVFKGTVTGVASTGGIVGEVFSIDEVSNCFVASGSVINGGPQYAVGGIVGKVADSRAKVINSYSLAQVIGKTGSAGGVTYCSAGSVTNCAFLKTATFNTDLPAVAGIGGTVTNTAPISDLTGDLLPLLNNGGTAWSQDPAGSWPLPAVIRDRSLGDYTPSPSTDNENFAGGYGTQAEPYLIANKTQLEYLRDQVNADPSFAKNKYFKQNADIDLDNAAWVPIGKITQEEYDWADPEDFGTPFSGVYDGDGYKITGLYIPTGSYSYESAGLFGFIMEATVKNLFVEGEILRGYYIGGIAGVVVQSDILNCFFSGTVDANYSAGGIVGTANGWQDKTNIKYCGVALGGGITGSCAGGIGAELYKTNIYSCYVLADVSWSYSVLVDALHSATTITQCAFLRTETVNTDGDAVPATGGTYSLVGYFANATSNVTITNGIGAFTGNLLALLNKGGEGQWRAAVGGENDGYPVLVVMK